MILRKLTKTQYERPPAPRPAVVLRYTVIEPGRQGIPPRYAMDALCDDGIVRTFIIGGKG